MRTSCLINNYNYREFVCEAVDSALDQTHAFDEVIVVDDGSTDDSLRLLRKCYSAERRVSIVPQANGGQLSAFNAAAASASGDVICFLDADDRYRRDYLAATLELYETCDVDFVVAGVEVFGRATATPRRLWRARDLGYSTISTILSRSYVGGPTSALSMRRWVAEWVLPCPFESDWRTRADDVLVLGSSMAGARKYQAETPYVEYRVHGNNNHTGRSRSAAGKFHHGLAVNRLVRYYIEQSGYDVDEIARHLHREFATIERPTLDEWWHYTKMSWQARLPLLVRARHFGETTVHFWRERLARTETVSPAIVGDDERTTVAMPSEAVEQRRAA